MEENMLANGKMENKAELVISQISKVLKEKENGSKENDYDGLMMRINVKMITI